jgi:hypothetical protein
VISARRVEWGGTPSSREGDCGGYAWCVSQLLVGVVDERQVCGIACLWA